MSSPQDPPHVYTLASFATVQALPSDGKLTACDRDARPLVLARQAFQMAGVADKVGQAAVDTKQSNFQCVLCSSHALNDAMCVAAAKSGQDGIRAIQLSLWMANTCAQGVHRKQHVVFLLKKFWCGCTMHVHCVK